METQRNSFVFYRSFHEATKDISDEYRKKIIYAIIEYELDRKEPEFEDNEGVCKSIWILIKPQLDANYKRFKNGCKGGRTEPKPNQSQTKVKPKSNQSQTKAEPNKNVNDNVNKNVNINKNKYGEYKHVLLTQDEHNKLIQKFGQEGADNWIKTLDQGIELKGYKYRSHYLAILNWSKNDFKSQKGDGLTLDEKRKKVEEMY